MRKDSAVSRRLLIITTKAPVAGEAKTRLTETGIPADEAARWAAAFLHDVVNTARNSALRATVWLALDGAAEDLPDDVQDLPCFPQSGNSLGERMVNILEHGFASGFETICLVGSDLPHLPLCFLQEAFGRLEVGAEAVFGPAEDGGYYLVGLRTIRRELFDGVPWSKPETFSETMKAAQTAAIQIATLPLWYDIDTAADVKRLITDLQRGVVVAPATSQAVGGKK